MKSKAQKRQEALARQVEYESMTVQDRLARLDRLKLTAKKERAKLAKKL
jgi:hypothetical protein